MYCHKCGTQIPGDGKFCPGCGAAAVSQENVPQASTNGQVSAASKEKHKPSLEGKALYFVVISTIIAFFIVVIVVNSGAERLVGKWQITTDDSPEYMEFYSDGTVAVGDSYGLNWDDEREVFDYRVEGDRLIFEGDGQSVLNVEYQLDGDLLRLDMGDGESLSFRKTT